MLATRHVSWQSTSNNIRYCNCHLFHITIITLNIDLILWHTQLNVCAVKEITHDLIHDFHFTFQAYNLPHTLNGICVSLF